jgi:ubiquitin-like-conjugating enzyme ATG3
MQYLRNAREYWTPVLTQSAFLERGVLTPAEFVKSCDHFILCFPSWKWCSGDPNGSCSYLPKNKQFLITRGAPSYHRVTNSSTIITKNNIEDDWEETDITKNTTENNIENDWEETNINDINIGKQNIHILNDHSDGMDDVTSHIIKCRRYDISITYDKYYQTPRCWLVGFNEEGNLLTTEELFMDIVKDYADKTVTIELHPHLFTPHVYIHPCRHAQVMKNMIDHMINHGNEPRIEQYMMLFIKFIQSVIPTIEYDYTMDVTI